MSTTVKDAKEGAAGDSSRRDDKTMRAWVYGGGSAARGRGRGFEDGLTLRPDAPRPPFDPASARARGSVLVRVLYASLNPADYKLAELGLPARALLPPLPRTPGLDFAGVVAAVPFAPPSSPSSSSSAGGKTKAGRARKDEKSGDKRGGGGEEGEEGEREAGEEEEEEEDDDDDYEEETYAVGDRVFGHLDLTTRFGALGEYVVATLAGLARAPEGVSLEQACCVGTAAVTALQCIAPHVRGGGGERRRRRLSGRDRDRDRDRVFINGGSGGTGTFGIQIAKALGCWVAASCSAANADLCRALGADEVIDYDGTRDVCGVLRELAADDGDGDGDGEGDGKINKKMKKNNKKFRLVVDNVGTSPRDLYKAADDFLLSAADDHDDNDHDEDHDDHDDDDDDHHHHHHHHHHHGGRGGGRFVQAAVGTSPAFVRATASRALLPALLGGGRRPFSLLVMANRRADLARVARWMAEGRVRAVLDDDDGGDGSRGGGAFAYADVPDAYRRLKTGRARGKIVVRVAEE